MPIQLTGISDVQLQRDVISLDNHLDNEYAQHLLSGKALPINFSSYTTIAQTVSGPDVSLNISRAVTRLKAIFVTMFNSEHANGLTTEKGSKSMLSPNEFHL